MQPSKTNWKFEVLQPGFFLLTALFLVDLTFLIYQCSTVVQKITCLLLAFYLIGLLFHKYHNLKWLISFVFLLAVIIFNKNNQYSAVTLNNISEIKIYPDELKINDNWFSGEGRVANGKVLVSGTLTDRQVNQIMLGHELTLTNIKGKIAALPPATNYGQFDIQKYYYGKNIRQQVKLESCNINVTKGGISDYFHHLRFKLKMFFKKMPPILSFFSSELILGENPSQDYQSILDNYRDLGVIHILSISGLHVGIYTLAISTFCYYLKLTEGETFSCCLLVLLIGIFLSNNQAGFIRASLTYTLGQVFRMNKIPLSKPDLLGLTAILHLAVNPRLMMGTGALLSYVLALGLIMTKNMSNFKQSVALNFLLTPLLLFHFFQFNFLTVIFNLLIVPYFNWIVMPVTFINLLIFSLKPGISKMFEAVLATGEKFIAWLSATKVGLLTFGKINWWQCLILLLLTSIVLVMKNDSIHRPKLENKIWKLISVVYALIFISIHFPLKGQVTLIDVGQGDSILITSPFPRKVYLIDVGGKLNFGSKKVTPQINKITIPFLKAQGISKIDGIFVTHQDADHVGDLRPLLNEIKVDKLYTAKGLLKNPSFRKRIEGRLKKQQVKELLAGKSVFEPQITFHVVYPFKPGLGQNEDSLSLIFKLAGKKWLFTGDLGQEGEKEIMDRYQLKADYFKLGHHGSRTASNPEFLQHLQPEITFISAGRDNRFGHPHPEVISTLDQQQVPYVSTQDCGMITWNYSKFFKSKFKQFLPVTKK